MTFNRHAANEVRKRLQALVGADAFGVTVLTYHSLAMRLTGVSFQRNTQVDEQRLLRFCRKLYRCWQRYGQPMVMSCGVNCWRAIATSW